jgi:hypothetical protein
MVRRRFALGQCGEHAFYTFVRATGEAIQPGGGDGPRG